MQNAEPEPPGDVQHRIEQCLSEAEKHLSILSDGIAHWDEPLPPMGRPPKPRRFPLDDINARTVGDVIRSRYADSWSLLLHWTGPKSSLARAYENRRMTAGQAERYRSLLERTSGLEPSVAAHGLDERAHPGAQARDRAERDR